MVVIELNYSIQTICLPQNAWRFYLYSPFQHRQVRLDVTEEIGLDVSSEIANGVRHEFEILLNAHVELGVIDEMRFHVLLEYLKCCGVWVNFTAHGTHFVQTIGHTFLLQNVNAHSLLRLNGHKCAAIVCITNRFVWTMLTAICEIPGVQWVGLFVAGADSFIDCRRAFRTFLATLAYFWESRKLKTIEILFCLLSVWTYLVFVERHWR